MFDPSYTNKPTRAAIWRSNLVILEIVVLLVAIIVQVNQAHNTITPPSDPTPVSRDVLVYIAPDHDTFTVVDGDTIRHFPFTHCDQPRLSLTRHGNVPTLHSHPAPEGAEAVLSLRFSTTQEYSIQTTPTDLSLYFGEHDRIWFSRLCTDTPATYDPTHNRAVYLNGDTIFLADYPRNDQPQTLLILDALCQLVWDGAAQGRDWAWNMAIPTNETGAWLPVNSRIAFTFRAESAIEIQDDLAPMKRLTFDNTSISLYADCFGSATQP